MISKWKNSICKEIVFLNYYNKEKTLFVKTNLFVFKKILNDPQGKNEILNIQGNIALYCIFDRKFPI